MVDCPASNVASSRRGRSDPHRPLGRGGRAPRLALVGLLSGRRSPDLRTQRTATNRALADYRDSAAGLDVDALAPAAADELASANSRLDGLDDLRQDVNRGSIAPGAALDAYNTTIADLINTNRGLITGIADPQLAQRVGATRDAVEV